MKRIRSVSLLAGLLALAAIGTASEIEGTWEGTLQGAKAVTLTVREREGRVEGNAVFYIIRREDPAQSSGSASPHPAARFPLGRRDPSVFGERRERAAGFDVHAVDGHKCRRVDARSWQRHAAADHRDAQAIEGAR